MKLTVFALAILLAGCQTTSTTVSADAACARAWVEYKTEVRLVQSCAEIEKCSIGMDDVKVFDAKEQKVLTLCPFEVTTPVPGSGATLHGWSLGSD